jgi:eukaryotic-like serine/threonine-protein kinase
MIGRIVLGEYLVSRQLGEGNMGKVYLAKRKSDGKAAVVKVMHDHLASDPKFRELFEREMQFMARFKHPNVVELYDASTRDPKSLCIVMEYVAGTDLEELLKRHKRFPLERVASWLGPLCSALAAAHSQGVIHRDLKPANIMLLNPGTDGETVKVMDFGLAKLSTSVHISLDKLKGVGGIVATGTPEYIAPEQVRGDELDHRSDLYAVGVILFELLTGKLPFNAPTVEKLLMAHVEQPVPSFASAGAAGMVPREVEAVVARCMSKYPVERPRDAWELGVSFEKAYGEKIMPNEKPAAAAAPPPKPIINRPRDPNATYNEVEAWMPEKIAVIKLKGYVDDMHGEVIESVPGKIVVHFGQSNCVYQMPGAPKPQPKSSGLGGWFGGKSSTPAAPAKLIQMELQMDKKDDPRGNFLHITVAVRPKGGAAPRSFEWQDLCNQIFKDLRAYLITK